MKKNRSRMLTVWTIVCAALIGPVVVRAAYETISRSYTLVNMVYSQEVFCEVLSITYTVTNMLSSPPDFSEVASRSYTVTSKDPPIPADCDGDGWITSFDYRCFVGCVTGPDGGIRSGCSTSDMHRDGDVDLQDYVEFEKLYMGL